MEEKAVGPRKRAAVRLATQLRTDKAVALRLSGLTLREIGARLGVTRGRVSQMIIGRVAEVRERSLDRAEQLLILELARLDALQVALWPNRKSPKAAGAIIHVIKRRCMLLGLAAPNRTGLAPIHGQPVPAKNTTIDLSRLSREELNWLETILTKAGPAESDCGAGEPINANKICVERREAPTS